MWRLEWPSIVETLWNWTVCLVPCRAHKKDLRVSVATRSNCMMGGKPRVIEVQTRPGDGTITFQKNGNGLVLVWPDAHWNWPLDHRKTVHSSLEAAHDSLTSDQCLFVPIRIRVIHLHQLIVHTVLLLIFPWQMYGFIIMLYHHHHHHLKPLDAGVIEKRHYYNDPREEPSKHYGQPLCFQILTGKLCIGIPWSSNGHECWKTFCLFEWILFVWDKLTSAIFNNFSKYITFICWYVQHTLTNNYYCDITLIPSRWYTFG